MIAQDGTSLDALQAFLVGSGIEHFTAREIAPVGRTAGFAKLRYPPQALWQNIIPTLRLLEELRAEFDHPVEVLSGYRDAAYNHAVGGERASLHLHFNAIDFRCDPVSSLELARWLHAHKDTHKLGIGAYPSFVHLDTRGLIGRLAPARWYGHGLNDWWNHKPDPAA